MLEAFVSSLLNRFLGDFIEGLESDQLNLQLWKGDVQLRNVKLRRDALRFLDLPIDISKGIVGTLTLKVPWKNLKTEPVHVVLDQVFALALPRTAEAFDPVYEEERKQREKMDRLEKYEADRAAAKQDDDEKQKLATFESKLTQRILANLQFVLTNVHIRYEDNYSCTGVPLAFGVTIAKVSVVSTNDQWVPQYVKKPGDFIHKSVDLDSLAVYFNNQTVLFTDLQASELVAAFQGFIASKTDSAPGFTPQQPPPPQAPSSPTRSAAPAVAASPGQRQRYYNQYIVKPISGLCQLRIHSSFKVTLGIPKIDAKVAFDPFEIDLYRLQYHHLLLIMGTFANLIKSEPYRALRPPPDVTPKQKPHVWWKFAYNAIVMVLRQNRERWTWRYFKERREDRLMYVRLYKLVKKQKESKANRQEFVLLEKKLSFEDIRLYRFITSLEIKKERLKLHKKPSAVALKPPPAAADSAGPSPVLNAPEEATPKKGMPKWLKSIASKSQKSLKTASANLNLPDAFAALDSAMPSAESLASNDSQLKSMYAAIEFDDNSGGPEDEGPFPSEYVWMTLSLHVVAASVTIRSDQVAVAQSSPRKSEGPISRPPLLVLAIDRFSLDLALRSAAYKLSLGLRAIRLMDASGIFVGPKIEGLASSPAVNKSPKKERGLNAAAALLREVVDEKDKTRIFNLIYEHAPADERADDCLQLELQPLEINYNKTTIDQILTFLKPPADDSSLDLIKQLAGERLHEIKKLTTRALQSRLEAHKTIDLNVDLRAPIIILPNDSNAPTFYIVVDLGHFNIHSNVLPLDVKKQLLTMRTRDLNSEERSQLQQSMVDKFEMKLSSLQLLMGESLPELRSALVTSSKSAGAKTSALHIVDRVDAQIFMNQCFVDSQDMPRLLISGELPLLSIHLGPKTYDNAMTLIDTFMSSFMVPKPRRTDDDESDANVPLSTDLHPSAISHIERFGRAAKVVEYDVSLLLPRMGDRDYDDDDDDDESDFDGGSEDDDGVSTVSAGSSSAGQHHQKEQHAGGGFFSRRMHHGSGKLRSIKRSSSRSSVASSKKDKDHHSPSLSTSSSVEQFDSSWQIQRVRVELRAKKLVVTVGNLTTGFVEDLSLLVVDRTYDTTVKLTMDDVKIMDDITNAGLEVPTSHFLRLVKDTAAKQQHAMDLVVVQASSKAPELRTALKSRLQSVLIQLGIIDVTIDRDTFLPFAEYLTRTIIIPSLNVMPSTRDGVPINLLLLIDPQSEGGRSPSANTSDCVKMYVQTDLQGINIVLNAADGSPYAQATVGMSSVIVQETHYTMGLEGSVGPLELKDARQTTAITRDPLIHTSKQPVGTFAHQKWKRQHPSKPNYNESLTLRLNTIQIKYNEDLIFGLVEFGVQLASEAQSLVDVIVQESRKTLEAVQVIIKKTHLFKVDVELSAPVLLLPIPRSQDTLSVSLGVLTANNEFLSERCGDRGSAATCTVEKLTVALHGLDINTFHPVSPLVPSPASVSSILSKYGVTLFLNRLLDLDAAPPAVPLLSINVDIPQLRITVNEEQYALFIILGFYVNDAVATIEQLIGSTSASRKNSSGRNTAATITSRKDSTPRRTASVSSGGGGGGGGGGGKSSKPLQPVARPQLAVSTTFQGIRLKLQRRPLSNDRFATSTGSRNSKEGSHALGTPAILSPRGTRSLSTFLDPLPSPLPSPSPSPSFSNINGIWDNLAELAVGAGSLKLTIDAKRTLDLRANLTHVTVLDKRLFCDWDEHKVETPMARAFRPLIHLGSIVVPDPAPSAAPGDTAAPKVGEEEGMSVHVSLEVDSDMQIIVNIPPLRAIVVADFLLSLQHVFVTALRKELEYRMTAPPKPKATKAPERPHRAPASVPKPADPINVHLALSSLDLWLVHDPTSVNSNCLRVCLSSTSVTVIQKPVFTAIQLNGLGLFAAPAQLNGSSTESSINIINPVDFDGSFTLQNMVRHLSPNESGTGQHETVNALQVVAQAKVNPLSVRVSYLDVRLLVAMATTALEELSVYKRFSGLDKNFDDDGMVPLDVMQLIELPRQSIATSQPPPLEVMVPLRDPQSQSEELLGTVGEAVKSKIAQARRLARFNEESIDIVFSGVSVRLIDDCGDAITPLVALSIGNTRVALSNWTSGEIIFDANIRASLDFFNNQRSHWEPLMEAWNVGLEVRGEGDDSPNPKLSLALRAKEEMQLNVSYGMLRTILQTANKWTADLKTVRERHGKVEAPRRRTEYYPYLVRNLTGEPISVWLVKDEQHVHTDVAPISVHTPEEARRAPPDATSIGVGESKPWTTENWNNLAEKGEKPSSERIGVAVNSARVTLLASDGIPAGSEGHHLLSLVPQVDGLTVRLVCDVEWKHGVKVLTFRSPYTLHNGTTHPIEVMIFSDRATVDERALILDAVKDMAVPKLSESAAASTTPFRHVIVEPRSMGAVPLLEAYHSVLHFRPQQRGDSARHTWTKRPIAWRKLSEHSMLERKTVTAAGLPFCVRLEAINEGYGVQRSIHARPPSSAPPGTTPRKGSAPTSQQVADDDSYPFVALHVTSPIILENLLPYDIRYSLTDEGSGYVAEALLAQGESVPIFEMDLLNVINLRVSVLGTRYQTVQPCVLNNPAGKLSRSCQMTEEGADGSKFLMGVSNTFIRCGGGSRCVVLYSPFVLVNRTSMPLWYKQVRRLAGDGDMVGGASSTSINSAASSDHGDVVFDASTSLHKSHSSSFADLTTTSSAASSRKPSLTLGSDDPVTIQMFSYSKFDPINNRLAVRSTDVHWSTPFSIDAVGSEGEIHLKTAAGLSAQLGVEISMGQGRFYRTKVVTFTPRFICINQTGWAVQLEQCDGSGNSLSEALAKHSGKKTNVFVGVNIGNGDHTKFHFQNEEKGFEKKHFVHIRLSDSRTFTHGLSSDQLDVGHEGEWSAPLLFENIGDYYIKLRERKGDHAAVVLVKISLHGSIVVVTLTQCRKSPPLRIDNRSQFPVTFWQSCTKGETRYVAEPYTGVPYVFDYPSTTDRDLVLVINKSKRTVNMAVLGSSKPFAFKGGVVGITVIADRATRVLRLDSLLDERSLRLQQRPSVISLSLAQRHEDEAAARSIPASTDPSPPGSIAVSPSTSNESLHLIGASQQQQQGPVRKLFSATFALDGIAVSFINSEPREIILLSLKGIEGTYAESTIEHSVQFRLVELQLDNQLHQPNFPVVLHRMPPRTESARARHAASPQPLIQCTVIVSKSGTSALTMIPYMSFLMQELAVNIEETFIIQIVRVSKQLALAVEPHTFLQSAGKLLSQEDLSNAYAIGAGHGGLTSSSSNVNLSSGGGGASLSKKKKNVVHHELYFELLQVQPLRMTVSFERSKAVATTATSTTATDPYSAKDISVQSLRALGVVLDVLSFSIGSIHGAPIKLNALELRHPTVTSDLLLQLFARHYLQQGLAQLHRVVGSVDIIGNPMGLWTNLATGVEDFFYEPYQGLVRSPEEFAKGLGRGTASLLKNSVVGLFDGVSRITDSVGKGLAEATFDPKFQQERRDREAPSNALAGVATGATTVYKGFSSGLTGIFSKPAEGARQAGTLGFVKGLGSGLIGAVTKPVVGVFDGATQLAQGIKNTATIFDDKNAIVPKRLPRHLGADHLLRPFNLSDAQGAYTMRHVDKFKFAKDMYLSHHELVPLPNTEKLGPPPSPPTPKKGGLNDIAVDLKNLRTSSSNLLGTPLPAGSSSSSSASATATAAAAAIDHSPPPFSKNSGFIIITSQHIIAVSELISPPAAEWSLRLKNIRGFVQVQGGNTLVLLLTANVRNATDIRISSANKQALKDFETALRQAQTICMNELYRFRPLDLEVDDEDVE